MREKSSPLQRFELLLGVFLLAASLLVGVTVAWRMQVLLVQQTVTETSDAINRHLRMFEAGEFLEHAEHGGGGGEYALTDAVVRGHFDIYAITYAAFHDASGVIRYSYVPGETGRSVAPENRQAFANALSGKTWVDTRVNGSPSFRIALPVRESPEAPAVGAVILERDITGLAARIRGVQVSASGVILVVVLLLYLSLRRVFLTATVQIRSKSVELEGALRLVESTYDATLKALTAALDTRDSETEGHSQRVTAYAVRLAREMGISGTHLVSITRGALLHDVGKIGVPDSILRKPGPLSPEEWALMRQHPSLGYEMLREIEFLRPALPIVLHHQEKYDGTGYPSGLKGDAIPLGARIFAVCDTLDAITSDRPYRAARSFAEAAAEIRKASGTQFDPAVVEAFLRVPESHWTAIRTSTCARVPMADVAAAL